MLLIWACPFGWGYRSQSFLAVGTQFFKQSRATRPESIAAHIPHAETDNRADNFNNNSRWVTVELLATPNPSKKLPRPNQPSSRIKYVNP